MSVKINLKCNSLLTCINSTVNRENKYQKEVPVGKNKYLPLRHNKIVTHLAVTFGNWNLLQSHRRKIFSGSKQWNSVHWNMPCEISVWPKKSEYSVWDNYQVLKMSISHTPKSTPISVYVGDDLFRDKSLGSWGQ